MRLAPPTGGYAIAEHRPEVLGRMRADTEGYLADHGGELDTLVGWLDDSDARAAARLAAKWSAGLADEQMDLDSQMLWDMEVAHAVPKP